jgi:hypothetical protein
VFAIGGLGGLVCLGGLDGDGNGNGNGIWGMDG